MRLDVKPGSGRGLGGEPSIISVGHQRGRPDGRHESKTNQGSGSTALVRQPPAAAVRAVPRFLGEGFGPGPGWARGLGPRRSIVRADGPVPVAWTSAPIDRARDPALPSRAPSGQCIGDGLADRPQGGLVNYPEALDDLRVSCMNGNIHMQFIREGVAVMPPPYPVRMENGCSRLPITAEHYGPTNSGARRSLASRLPYVRGDAGDG